MHDNSPGAGEKRIIEGWEIFDIDGTIRKYGYVADESDAGDALRRLPSWGNHIGKGKYGSSGEPENFYYQWDLKVIEDVNGQRTRFFYRAEHDNRVTITEHAYTGESAISYIRTPVGDTIKFEYDTITGNEGRW